MHLEVEAAPTADSGQATCENGEKKTVLPGCRTICQHPASPQNSVSNHLRTPRRIRGGADLFSREEYTEAPKNPSTP